MKNIQRLPAIQVQTPEDFAGPSRFEAKQRQELEEWDREWADMGLPPTYPQDVWQMAKQALQDATTAWGHRADHEEDLMVKWMEAMDAVKDTTGCNEYMVQWLGEMGPGAFAGSHPRLG